MEKEPGEKWEEYLRLHEFVFRKKISEENFIERLSLGPNNFFRNTFAQPIKNLTYPPRYTSKQEVILAGDYGLFLVYSSFSYNHPEYIFRTSLDFRHIYYDLSEWYYKKYLPLICAFEKEIRRWKSDGSEISFYQMNISPDDIFSKEINVHLVCTVEHRISIRKAYELE